MLYSVKSFKAYSGNKLFECASGSVHISNLLVLCNPVFKHRFKINNYSTVIMKLKKQNLAAYS